MANVLGLFPRSQHSDSSIAAVDHYGDYPAIAAKVASSKSHISSAEAGAASRRRARPCLGTEVDHGRRVPGTAGDQAAGELRITVLVEQRASFLRERFEDGMFADPAKPVGGVAGVGLAAMGDAVPVGRARPFSLVVGLLGGVVAGVPEVVDLEQAGGKAEPRTVRRAGKDRDPGGLGQ